MSGVESAWNAALAGGGRLVVFGLLAGTLAAALDWAAWRAAHRLRWTKQPAGHLLEWTSGLASLPTSPLRGGEPVLVALGYGVLIGGAALWIGLAILLIEGTRLPGGLGLFAFVPLLFAFGYSLAAQGAATQEAARRRLLSGGRILFATPAWAITVAAWASLTGALGPLAAAGEVAHPALRIALTGALLLSGIFVLPGAAGDLGMSARPWGGDAHEASRAVRALTALAHYAGLASVCSLAAVALGGGAAAGLGAAILPIAAAGLAAIVLRHLAAGERTAVFVRRGAAALPLVLLASGIVIALWPGRAA